ncbi:MULTISPECIES: poly-beta-1,6-N-acetyl-D-glucosamine synthase [unclassified Tatumella]|uniref:poly-beta-1,6-N-acetyl-D-glucosamine synthase n=1 Tax=unclassified Tatumella TaxID=2649542 RepID=UPI001BB0D46F|nr:MULTISPECIES: poly-beta-1,6-N-acetyl-D-glucosamine synthase [unclassified Tatumella]MBS0856272.1 poly-beta-1,6 N-acetyl-D-glucosamine synthase [Tatumella sp. JGM16]MBS0895437.1 poly-beta-1,6 N-acetyl-D-glucosamine synthase [Tatumella sp. JGM130]MBS0913419.1 poly-beta-1,6 N-acetyl-D-glucosamine synthase [Tatumella sp. JGM91]
MTDRLIALIILCVVLSIPLGFVLVFTGQVALNFVFYWPLFMAGIWIAGGVYFWFNKERFWRQDSEITLPGNPLISILIPCYNEGPNARETIQAALNQNYTNIEVIAVNDGSKDDTGEILNQLASEHNNLRVIHLAKNQGKAVALKAGAAAANSELLVCIDGDAILDRNTAAYLAAPLLNFPGVGAVTGNPRIRTRSTLIGRLQVGEFSSIIGLIKRAQRVYGHVFTVSGVIAAFRRTALADVGYWSDDMITEDIDISWKLQLKNWSIFYEPRALCWILMPETLKGLWQQRLRWAKGGAEVFLKNCISIWRWQHRRMWTLLLEFALSTIWTYMYLLSIILFVLGRFTEMPKNLYVDSLMPPGFTGLLLAVVCIIQFSVSLMIERRYESDIFKSLFWVIWYPIAYWLLSFLTTLVSFPNVMLSRKGKRARWESPDRGIAQKHLK